MEIILINAIAEPEGFEPEYVGAVFKHKMLEATEKHKHRLLLEANEQIYDPRAKLIFIAEYREKCPDGLSKKEKLTRTLLNADRRIAFFKGRFFDAKVDSSIAIPLIRKTFPKLIADQIVSVQPLTGPSSLIYYMRYKYANSRQQTSQTGTSVFGSSLSQHQGMGPTQQTSPHNERSDPQDTLDSDVLQLAMH